MLALRLPAAVGVKVTEIVQLAPAASVLGLSGQVFVWAKSLAFAPLTATVLIVSAAVPELVSVTFCAALVVPTACCPKLRLVGFNVATGACVGVLNRLRMFAVMVRPTLLATMWSQLQKPSV